MPTPTIHETDFAGLSSAERLLLAQDLWDSVIAEVDTFQMTDEEHRWIEQRIAEANDPNTVWYSWPQVVQSATRVR